MMAKILTIEDSAFERKAIINMLSKAGYKDIIEAETAEEALEKYKSEKPDLVLLDLRLPGMDGIECFKELKKINPRVKVVVVSIVTRQDSIDECMKLGAKAYIMKPVTQNKLIDPIKKVLG
jgi:two-component system chemotaxis response regulator CheY